MTPLEIGLLIVGGLLAVGLATVVLSVVAYLLFVGAVVVVGVPAAILSWLWDAMTPKR